MKIEIYTKNVYGNELTYFVDSKEATAIRILTSQKTLSEGNRKALETLGFTFEEILAPKKS